jgi:hypothetical protein
MKRSLVLSSLMFVIVLAVLLSMTEGGTTVQAEDSLLAVKTPTSVAYPGPNPLPPLQRTATPTKSGAKTPPPAAYPGPIVPQPAVTTPTKQPTKQPPLSAAPVYQSKIAINLNGMQPPTFTIVSSNLPPTSSVTVTLKTLKWSGPPLPKATTFAQPSISSQLQPGDLVDNWNLLYNENFEGTFPRTPCVISDTTNSGRYWGLDTFYSSSPTHAIWPARSGPNGVNPATNNYPPNFESWLICGPFDSANAKNFMTQFMIWLDITDPNDYFGVGYSTNGQSFTTVQWQGSTGGSWYRFDVGAYNYVAPQMWVALSFHSGNNVKTTKGAWVDDLKVWRHNKELTTCGDLDPGKKGLHVPSHEIAQDQHWYPIIRNGDTLALQGVIAAKAQWVRLVFRRPDPASEYTMEQEFDRIVDSLCNAGISVLGVVNQESLSLPYADVNDPAKAAAYRQEFVNTAGWYASYFKGRIKYWEIWNEPFAPATGVNADKYAALLNATYQTIKTVSPDLKVVFGGLGSAWYDADDYFRQVYDYLGAARPFDYFALHPYSDGKSKHGVDPTAYMHAFDQKAIGERTIVDKFFARMQSNGDGNKKIWVTEIGWTSSLGDPGVTACTADIAVNPTEQAVYLKKGFDILFNEVPAVDKVFWYQYQDVRTQCRPMTGGMNFQIGRSTDDTFMSLDPTDEPGFWGLYESDKRTPKLSRCVFAAYPNSCSSLYAIFLPLIMR